jgi:hypothetical protein
MKIPAAFLTQLEKNNPNIHLDSQWIPNKTVLKKKNKSGGIAIPAFKIYFKATIIKTI